MTPMLPSRTALLVIDVPSAFAEIKAANLAGEFATIVHSADILRAPS